MNYLPDEKQGGGWLGGEGIGKGITTITRGGVQLVVGEKKGGP